MTALPETAPREVIALVDDYIAMWNETDPARRRALIARTWRENATYADPALESCGHEAIDAMVRAVQERFPGHRFRRTGPVDAHHDRLRFGWALASQEGSAVVAGSDVGIVADGRLASMSGFFDTAPAAVPAS